MWVDNDVPNWLPTLKNFYRSPFSKWPPQYRKYSTLSNFNDIHMWVDYDVPKWLLTSKNFYRSPFSKWPPQYRTNSTLSDFNDISYVGRLGQKKKGVFSDCMVFRIRVGRTGFFFFFEFLIIFFFGNLQVCSFL